MGNLLVLTLCTQGLHRLHGQFVGTHIVHIGPTQVAWAICWYPHCAHRAYIGCMGNLLVPHCAHRGYIGEWAICWYSHCAHRAYIGCMGNLLVPTLCRTYIGCMGNSLVPTLCTQGPTQFAWHIATYIGCMGNLLVPTLCTQGLHRLHLLVHIVLVHRWHGQFVGTHCATQGGNLLVFTLWAYIGWHGQFVGTHIVHIEPTQVAWAICWYSHCAHRAYIGCMGNLLVFTLCTQSLHRLHGQFVGTHIVNIGATQVAWAICWYSHCAHRAYIGCMGNLLVLTLRTQGLHSLHGQFVGTHIVNIEPTQVAWAICWYPHCEHRAYIGCMGNLLVPTLCTQNLHRLHGQFVGTHIVNIEPTQVAWAICWYPHCAHRGLHGLHGQFVGTHIVHIEPTQVAWAICWYPHCAHRAYIGCTSNLLVLTLCTQGQHSLHEQFVGTHIVHIEPTQVAWAICWYPHCEHRGYIGGMGNLLILTLCTQGLHRLHGQFVGTHIVHIGPTQVAWAICWYSHCAHRSYIVCMSNLLVLTLCTQSLHRLHGQFVGTHIVNIEPTQVAWAICWYPHCEHRGYIGGMGNLLVLTLCTQGLHRLHGQFVGTHIVHIGPTQVAWAICWYPHCEPRAYIGCLGNLLVPTLCTQGLHRLHGQFVGTHIVHIRAYIGCMGNLLVLTLYTQRLHRLHGQFVGTHIVYIEPTQVAWAICWYPHCEHRAYIGCMGNLLVLTLCAQGLHRLNGQFVGTHIVHIGPTQVAWAICWYPHCEPRAYIGCLGNLLVPTLCTQDLHRLHGQFVGTHIVHIGPTQVAWAICWYPHCAHRAYMVCMGNLLVPTLCTQNLHRLHGQFVGTHIVHIGPTQVAWAICWYPHCEHRGYIGGMGNLLVLTLCTQGLHSLHGQFVGTHIVHIEPTQVAWAICWYPHCEHRGYIGGMGNLLVLTLCTQGLHRLHGQFVGTHIVHIGPTQVAWAICWYPHCAHRAYIGCMGNLLVPTL